jgi:hypothetical protein
MDSVFGDEKEGSALTNCPGYLIERFAIEH